MIYGNSDLNDLFDTFFNNRGRGNYNYSTTVMKNDSEGESYEINHTKDGAYLFFEAPGFNPHKCGTLRHQDWLRSRTEVS